MIRYKLTTAVLILALAPSALFAQTPDYTTLDLPTTTYPATTEYPATTKRFSPPLAIVGGLTTTIGLMFLLSTIEMPDTSDGTTFNLTGSRYCVTNRPSEVKVQNGGCSNGAAAFDASVRPYAFGAIAAGLVMLKVGLLKVTVKETQVTMTPAVSTTSAALNGTLSWGGVK